jgi:hypothetical protein
MVEIEHGLIVFDWEYAAAVDLKAQKSRQLSQIVLVQFQYL